MFHKIKPIRNSITPLYKLQKRSFHHVGSIPKSSTAEEALRVVKSKDRVFVQGMAATPNKLITAMVNRASELRGVEVIHLHTEGPALYASSQYKDNFFCNNLFTGANTRKAVQEGTAGYIPIFLSEIPLLFTRKILPIDVALVQVSPPDKHGFCSLGISVDATITAVECAKHVIAQVNPHMPRTQGDGLIHFSNFDSIVEVNEPLPENKPPAPDDIQIAIGRNVASIIEDGATLQTGIGAIPDAVLISLRNHKRLGVHTEMFSDGIIDLVERGVITNEEKKINRNQISAGFIMGSRKLYDFVDDNPFVKLYRIQDVNNPVIIAQNPKATAINSAIEIDLTGQICADSIGSKIFSGVGGQMDFMRGAALSERGKPIIALPSTTRKGESRIVPFLKSGAGVVTTRAHAHYVVTEYGVAFLFGKNLQQRAEELIKISHPNHREKLMAAVKENFKLLF